MPYPLPYTLPTVLPGPLDLAAPGRIDGTLTPAPDACAEGEGLILSQYRESPKVLAWLCSYLTRIGETDAAAVVVYEDALDVERAQGVWLDSLGSIVGEPRRERGDYEYRRGVRVRILANRSNGGAPALARIARLHEEIADPAASVRVRWAGPGRVVVYIDATAAGLPGWPHGYLQDAAAAGVLLQTVTIPYGVARSSAFRLCDVADAESKSAIGLADVALTFGGSLASVLS